MLGVLLAAPSLLLPHAGDRLSRRSALLGGAAALTVTLPDSPARAIELPTYDEEGRVINKAGYEEETGFRSVSGKDDAASSAAQQKRRRGWAMASIARRASTARVDGRSSLGVHFLSGWSRVSAT